MFKIRVVNELARWKHSLDLSTDMLLEMIPECQILNYVLSLRNKPVHFTLGDCI
jgi:hypothetical protein